MGFFEEYEQSYTISNPVDNSNNDTVTYPTSFELSLHIIRPNNSEANVLGDEIADFVANPTGDLTSTIKKNASIVGNGRTYQVINIPEYRPLTNVTSLDLKLIVNA
jgi:hypothetical protein